MVEVDLAEYDDEQVKLMGEMCLLVNERDERIGFASKKACHLNQNINQGMLHRAFSVFLFNSNNQLLLQERAAGKITFPSMLTNACCSHPLDIKEELEEVAQLGVKKAAQRKLYHELGIKPEQVPLDKFHFLTRIHYKAASDTIWGEHEVDYILFIKADVDLNLNPNEVSSVRYVNPDQLRGLLMDSKEGKVAITPWFKLICETLLFDWWRTLDSAGELGVLAIPSDPHTIHKY